MIKLYKFMADLLSSLPYTRTTSLWVDWLLQQYEYKKAETRGKIC